MGDLDEVYFTSAKGLHIFFSNMIIESKHFDCEMGFMTVQNFVKLQLINTLTHRKDYNILISDNLKIGSSLIHVSVLYLCMRYSCTSEQFINILFDNNYFIVGLSK